MDVVLAEGVQLVRECYDFANKHTGDLQKVDVLRTRVDRWRRLANRFHAWRLVGEVAAFRIQPSLGMSISVALPAPQPQPGAAAAAPTPQWDQKAAAQTLRCITDMLPAGQPAAILWAVQRRLCHLAPPRPASEKPVQPQPQPTAGAPASVSNELVSHFKDVRVKAVRLICGEAGLGLREAILAHWTAISFRTVFSETISEMMKEIAVPATSYFSPAQCTDSIEEAVSIIRAFNLSIARCVCVDSIEIFGSPDPRHAPAGGAAPSSSTGLHQSDIAAQISIEELLKATAAARAYVYLTLSCSEVPTPPGGAQPECIPSVSPRCPLNIEGVVVSEASITHEHQVGQALAQLLLQTPQQIPLVSGWPSPGGAGDAEGGSLSEPASAVGGTAFPAASVNACEVEQFYAALFSTYATNGKLAYASIGRPPGGSDSVFTRHLALLLEESSQEDQHVVQRALSYLQTMRPLPHVDWARGLWESSQAHQLSLVLDKLVTETFAVPLSVYSPMDAYEEIPAEGAGVTADQAHLVTSPWAMLAHTLLMELREDAHSALLRKPSALGGGGTITQPSGVFGGFLNRGAQGSGRSGCANLQVTVTGATLTDVAGQWRAGRDVLRVVTSFTSALVSATANTFHVATERFGYAERNMLPFFLMVSDIFAVLSLHFDSEAVTALTQGIPVTDRRRSTLPKSGDPPKLNVKLLLSVSASPSLKHAPQDLSNTLAKLAVLIGVAVDKLRANANRYLACVFTHYATRGPNNRLLFFNTMGRLQEFVNTSIEGDTMHNPLDSDDESDDRRRRSKISSEDGDDVWAKRWSPFVSLAISSLLYPLTCVGKSVAQEVAGHLLCHIVTTMVETMVVKVERRTLSTQGKMLPVPEAHKQWPPPTEGGVDPKALAQRYPSVGQLQHDLDHLDGYVVLHAPEMSLHNLPCWTLPSALYFRIAKQG